MLLGRLYVLGLAIAGEEGVRDVVKNFLADFDITLGLSGLRSVQELNPSLLANSKQPIDIRCLFKSVSRQR